MYSECVRKQSVSSAVSFPSESSVPLCPTPLFLDDCTCCGLDVLGPVTVLLGYPFALPLSHASLFPRLLLHFSRAHPSSFLTKGTWEIHVLRSHKSKNVFVPPSKIFSMSTEFQVENHFSSEFWTLWSAIF